jgi:hypothetical protein
MAYDNQAPGWYLLDPEADGTPPEGEAGSVTKVSKKEGYGIMSSVMSLVSEHVEGADTLVEVAREASEAVASRIGGEADSAEETEIDNPLISSPAASASPKASTKPAASPAKKTVGAPVATGSGGGRAAAMRLEMAQSGTLNEQSAQEKFQRADQIAALQTNVTQLEGRVEKMEGSMRQMQDRIAQLEAQKGGCACTVS